MNPPVRRYGPGKGLTRLGISTSVLKGARAQAEPGTFIDEII